MPRKPQPSGFICYHCQSPETSKAGFNRGKQRFFCRSCRRFFRENPLGTIVSPPEAQGSSADPKRGESELILKLIAIAQQLGKTPTVADIDSLSKRGRAPKISIFYEVFGSYRAALKRAGLSSRYGREIEKEPLLAELRRLRQKIGRPLFGKDVAAARKRGEVAPLSQYQKAFITVPEAIKAAGAGKPFFSREALIKQLRELDGKLDRPVTENDLQQSYRLGTGASVKSFIKEFGTIRRARLAAGVKTVYDGASNPSRFWRKYSSDQLIEILRRVGTNLGRKPTDRDLNKLSKEGDCPSHTTFAHRFGSLTQAYLMAGFAVRPRTYTPSEIVESVQKLALKLGRIPSFNDLKSASKRGECPSPNTIYRQIGKMDALRARLE